MNNQKELLKDLRFQLSSLDKEIKHLSTRINVKQLEITQDRYNLSILKEKRSKLKSEIYSQTHVNKFQ